MFQQRKNTIYVCVDILILCVSAGVCVLLDWSTLYLFLKHLSTLLLHAYINVCTCTVFILVFIVGLICWI